MANDDVNDPAWIFGTMVRGERKNLRLTQTELAARIGSTQAFVSDTERGLTNPPLRTLQAFAEALECQPDFFTAFHAFFTHENESDRVSISPPTREESKNDRPRASRSSRRGS